MVPRRLILESSLSPGDIVILTAAVRDLHETYPGRFITDVRMPCPEIWEHNPYITPLLEIDPSVSVVQCEYPLVNRSNFAPYHFIHGYRKHLNDVLNIQIRAGDFCGDIHLSDEERSWMSQVEETHGIGSRFWIIVAGGKLDFTAKWWSHTRYQEVVDSLRDEVRFVQVGSTEHYHPPLRGVVDLRGKTDLRQLIRLVYHADGVVCPVTLLMHLAAAVPTRLGNGRGRPCVVVAGGREAPHWEAYPTHQFLHTVGALECCQMGGCWKSRTYPLGDGSELDRSICQDVRDGLQHCMALISAKEVTSAVRKYLRGGAIERSAATGERARSNGWKRTTGAAR